MNHPISTYSNTTGGSLQIHSCAYKSFIPLNQDDKVFYLFNGIKKYFILNDGHGIDSDTMQSFSISSYTKEETSVEDQGFYQCAIAIHGPFAQIILSETADVQFSGFSFIL